MTIDAYPLACILLTRLESQDSIEHIIAQLKSTHILPVGLVWVGQPTFYSRCQFFPTNPFIQCPNRESVPIHLHVVAG